MTLKELHSWGWSIYTCKAIGSVFNMEQQNKLRNTY